MRYQLATIACAFALGLSACSGGGGGGGTGGGGGGGLPPAPGPLVANPTAVTVLSLPATPAPLALSEANYSGAFTESDTSGASCTGIATISPASGTAFTVTPVAVGNCSFTFTGNAGVTPLILPIAVTTTTVGGN